MKVTANPRQGAPRSASVCAVALGIVQAITTAAGLGSAGAAVAVGAKVGHDLVTGAYTEPKEEDE